jgi:integrase
MAIIKRGKDTYLVRVDLGRDPITKKRKQLNVTVHGSRATAKKVEAKLKAQKDAGQLVTDSKATLGTLVDSYLDFKRQFHSESTQLKNRNYFNKYVRPYLGSTPLKNITGDVLQSLFGFLLTERKRGRRTESNTQGEGGRGLAPGTVKGVKTLLSAAFNYAVTKKIMAENPARGTKLPKARERRAASSMTVEDANAFVSVRGKFRYGTAFTLQLHLGLRPQELMALIWEDVDFKESTIRVERACHWTPGVFGGFGPPKSFNGERRIKVAPPYMELLRAHREKQLKEIEECERRGESYGEPALMKWAMVERPERAQLYASANLIFCKPDGRVPNRVVPYLEFKNMLLRAGIEVNYRWYDLRHTTSTFVLNISRRPNRETAVRMGHSETMLLTGYDHPLESESHVGSDSLAELIPLMSDGPEQLELFRYHS